MKLIKTSEYFIYGYNAGHIYTIIDDDETVFDIIYEHGDNGGWRFFPSGKHISAMRFPPMMECIKKSEYEAFNQNIEDMRNGN